MYLQRFIESHINQNTLETTGVDIRKNSGPVVECHEVETCFSY